MRPAAARQVVEVLKEGPAPKGRIPAALTRGGPGVAFKTGTSYGFRDALAVGIVGDDVIGVWTGRADGGARAGLTGRDAALPLLFDIADQLHAPHTAAPGLAPKGAPTALASLGNDGAGPRLIFPPNGATIMVGAYGPASAGLTLSGRGDHLSWYVDGAAVPPDPVSGQPVWRPDGPGFYRIIAVDADGHRTQGRFRIKG
jgi:penicillin-binding protein 1C